MRIKKIILYFFTLQIMMFSEPAKLDKIIYYRYFPIIEDKLKSGMEIQKIRGYCILVDMKCTTSRGVFVAEEMDDWKQGPGESTLKKIDIDLSNFKKTFFIGEFRNDYPYFKNLKQEILKENKLRKKIERIKKMLFINDIMLETEMEKSSYRDYYTMGIDYEELTKKFSDYIIIRTDEISNPYIMDIKNYKPDEEKIELKNLNQIYQYFKNNPYRNLEYTSEKVDEYEKFIEKNININININEFENILQREIFELTKELDLQ